MAVLSMSPNLHINIQMVLMWHANYVLMCKFRDLDNTAIHDPRFKIKIGEPGTQVTSSYKFRDS
jgi:hypothetical protein